MKIGSFEISKKLIIIFAITIVLLVVVLIIKGNYVNKYEKYKIDKDLAFIYTYETYNESETDIPFVNIDSDFAKTLNSEIQKLGLSYKNSNTSNNSMSYRYNINDNFVSLVLILKKLNSENQLVFDYYTYVFDLNQNGKVLNETEILKMYNMTENKINDEISSEMVKKYDDEINKKIIPGTCNYSDCYLKLRKINKYTDNIHYYIEDGWLVAYTSYNVYSEYNEENYFTRDDFKFYITDKIKNN